VCGNAFFFAIWAKARPPAQIGTQQSIGLRITAPLQAEGAGGSEMVERERKKVRFAVVTGKRYSSFRTAGAVYHGAIYYV